MKYFYIITVLLLLLSCGKPVEPTETSTGIKQTETINTMVGIESKIGGGYGVPDSDKGER